MKTQTLRIKVNKDIYRLIIDRRDQYVAAGIHKSTSEIIRTSISMMLKANHPILHDELNKKYFENNPLTSSMLIRIDPELYEELEAYGERQAKYAPTGFSFDSGLFSAVAIVHDLGYI